MRMFIPVQGGEITSESLGADEVPPLKKGESFEINTDFKPQTAGVFRMSFKIEGIEDDDTINYYQNEQKAMVSNKEFINVFTVRDKSLLDIQLLLEELIRQS